MNRLLITGFEPFAGESMNPSYDAVKRLPEKIGEWNIVKELLPVGFKEGPEKLEEFIHKWEPQVVICVGQAGGRSCVNIERVAVNMADATIADNFGVMPDEQVLIKDGPDGFFSNLPVKKMAKNVIDHGYPCVVSNTAGTFVCNSVFYKALYMAAADGNIMGAGFIHVPFVYQQLVGDKISRPGMSLDGIAESIRYAIEAIPVL